MTLVTKALEASNVKVAFSNKPIPAPTTISSSTQPAWKKDEDEAPRKPAKRYTGRMGCDRYTRWTFC